MIFVACVAGGIQERASVRRSRHIPSRAKPAREFTSGEAASEFPGGNSTRLFTNPLTASPLVFTASYQNKSTRAPNPASYAGYDFCNIINQYIEINLAYVLTRTSIQKYL